MAQPAGGHVPLSNSSQQKPIDGHVHVVGTGTGGTGCWLRLSSWRRAMAALMLRHIGLPTNALNQDLDRLYVERLLEIVRGSSLGTGGILAQELVSGEHDRPRA